jgi:hypothetical protein
MKPILTPIDVANAITEAGGTNPQRPYFTERTANLVQPMLDEIAAAKQSYFISAKSVECSASALHNKLNDGLRWLIHYHPDSAHYRELRACLKFRRLLHGVEVIYAEPTQYGTRAMQPIAHSLAKQNYLDTFLAWTQTAKELDVFDSKEHFSGSIPITDEDQTALIKVCASLGIELDLNKANGTFRAMR